MKVCFSSVGDSSESLLDPRFGRAAFFAVADMDTMEFEIIKNTGADGGGAGIAAGQLMVDKGVQAVVTGSVGPNAMDVLKAAGIAIYKGSQVTIAENLDQFKTGSLEKIETTVPQHFGMQGGSK